MAERAVASLPSGQTRSMPRAAVLLWTWLTTLILLAASIAAAFVPLGSLNLGLALGIAAVQILLTALYSMHLRAASVAVKFAAAAALLFLYALAFLTFADYFTRSVEVAPWREPAAIAAPQ